MNNLIPHELKEFISISEDNKGVIKITYPTIYGLAGKTVLKDYLTYKTGYYSKFNKSPKSVVYQYDFVEFPKNVATIRGIALSDEDVNKFEKLAKKLKVTIATIDVF